jgi:hypothetical protein
MTKVLAKKFLKEALTHVESKSIREWATSEHNFPIWIEIAKRFLIKNGGPSEDNRIRLSTYIVVEAMGA